ncbi:hypothetical protein Y032_0828g2563 [Ancylostoma ceylanicum]|uniref:Uncharacterized protein n=1 Tax=Ancylostoma ceylanicum TaxID=53326 RepID=A0A016WDN4_9BILA|nr:hypothetical protein Y032_0828g2563 [Ancylostoma ceylanicum]
MTAGYSYIVVERSKLFRTVCIRGGTLVPTPHGSPRATELLSVKQRRAIFEAFSLISPGFFMNDSLQPAF